MSMKGSLMPFENNNDVKAKIKKAATKEKPQPKRSGGCFHLHFNNLWSIWYGLCTLALESYLVVNCVRRFFAYVALPWPQGHQPQMELNAYLGLVGTAVIVLPFFLVSVLFKVGNFANDGFKLGYSLSTCTHDPPSVLAQSGGVFRSLWQHGGPTAPFLHLVSAFCLLLPKLLMEAKLIQAGFLPKEDVWKTDLDFMVIHRDRLVVLSFMTSAINVTIPLFTTTPAPSAAVTKSLALQPEEWGPVSPEFINYSLALLVYSVRYPSVFWNTNKCFGTLFSFQLIANSLQNMLAFAGISVLYKVQVFGPKEILHRHEPFLLNTLVTILLYVLSNVLVLSSSLVLYLYGYYKFNAFLLQERERRVITLKEGRPAGWGYFTHCAALCVLLAIAVCNAPLLYDYTIVYRGSLDGAVLSCVIGGIMHLFLWIVIWLLLTVKQNWIFKLRVTVGRAAVRSARSVKLVTDVDLSYHRGEANTPLLVVGNGRTYTVADNSPKKAIMSVIQKAALEKKGNSDDDQIYWLRPKPPSPKSSPDSDRLAWLNRKISSSSTKHKVTFDDSLVGGAPRKLRSMAKSPKTHGKGKRSHKLDSLSESDDDGDYATLRELPLMSLPDQSDDTASEENKLLDSVQDDNVTYASTNRDLLHPGDYEEAKSFDPLLPPGPVLPGPVTAPVTVHSNTDPQFQGSVTPRCLRRADSGMPHDDVTPRSESVSTESSGSPPDHSNNSETSSGVHSNSSSENQHNLQQQQHQQDQQLTVINEQLQDHQQASRRSTSVDDLTLTIDQNPRVQPQWKSFSLQRNVQPPTSESFADGTNGNPNVVVVTNGVYGYMSHPQYHHVPSAASTTEAACLYNQAEDTVVIRRKQSRPKTTDLTPAEPFERSTNMRMTSFTDQPDFSTIRSQAGSSSSSMFSSPAVTGMHTMPCVGSSHTSSHSGLLAGSCHSFPRQHSTIPTHHNGVRLFGGPPFKRYPMHSNNSAPRPIPGPCVGGEANPCCGLGGHHTFPHTAGVKYNLIQHQQHLQDRDSANFSMASSGESDNYLTHT